MGSYNRTILIGNLGRDAELRATSGGTSVLNFSMAMSEAWKDKTSGERKESTTWVRVSLWGKAADAIAQYMTKGKQVAVEGKLVTHEWEKDGVKRSNLEVRADHVVLLGGRDTQQTAAASGGETPSEASDSQVDEDPIPF